MNSQIDIQENEILSKYKGVLDVLLVDHTTKSNILWATNNYSNLGELYSPHTEITPDLITGSNGNVIMPRVQKDKLLQQSRSRNMAEVFTPSWICNAQNNHIDNAWFNRDNVFNKEIIDNDGERKWTVNHKRITFPPNKNWKKYIREKRLEMACGEAPYITSRYDTTTGKFIPVKERIGIIDRKLRVINENVHSSGAWLKAAQSAFQATYGYEWQGDNLLLAREAMLFSFIENYRLKFDKEPLLKSIKYMAYIISWNIWQMDGLKCVIPNSCKSQKYTKTILFGKDKNTVLKCNGCRTGDVKNHNGIYCIVKNWALKDKITGKAGRQIRFVDLLKN